MSLRSLAARPAAVRRPSCPPDPPLPPRVRSRCPAARLPAWTAVPPAAPASACWRCSRPPSSGCRHSPLRNPLPQARCHRKARDDWRVRRPPSIRAMAPCRRSRRLRDTAVGAGRQARGGARTSAARRRPRGHRLSVSRRRSRSSFRRLHRRLRTRPCPRRPAGQLLRHRRCLLEWPRRSRFQRPRRRRAGVRPARSTRLQCRALAGTGRAARRNPADRRAPERDRHRPRPAARLGGLRSCGRGGARGLPRRGASRRATPIRVIAHADGDPLPGFSEARKLGARVVVGPLVRDDLRTLAAADIDLPTDARAQPARRGPAAARAGVRALARPSRPKDASWRGSCARRARRPSPSSAPTCRCRSASASAFVGEWILQGGGPPETFRFARAPEDAHQAPPRSFAHADRRGAARRRRQRCRAAEAVRRRDAELHQQPGQRPAAARKPARPRRPAVRRTAVARRPEEALRWKGCRAATTRTHRWNGSMRSGSMPSASRRRSSTARRASSRSTARPGT